MRKNKTSISGTGGGPAKYCSFTPSEELVINLLNIDESVNGISKASVFGVHAENSGEVGDLQNELEAQNIANESVFEIQTTPEFQRIPDFKKKYFLASRRFISLILKFMCFGHNIFSIALQTSAIELDAVCCAMPM